MQVYCHETQQAANCLFELLQLDMKFIFAISAIYLFLIPISAQQVLPMVVSSAGGHYQGSSLSLDWTIGQIVTTTTRSEPIVITQGFHQPSLSITAIENQLQNIDKVRVYPNPTADHIEVDLKLKRRSNIEIDLVDLNGKIVATKQIAGRHMKERFGVTNLPAGMYFLYIRVDHDKYLKSFKIQIYAHAK